MSNLLSTIPIDLKKVAEEDIIRKILQAGIIAELDAINLYEQMANLAKNEDIKKILLDIANEEKRMLESFRHSFSRFDPRQKRSRSRS